MDLPLAVYGINQNQKSAYEFIVGGGCAEGIGFVENHKEFIINKVNSRKAVTQILDNKSSKNQTQKIIDGNGSNRICEEITKLI